MAETRPQYMTPAGHTALIEELARLGQERTRVVQGVADAAAEGDRSENAEYIYGKKRLREKLQRKYYSFEELNEPDA